MSRPDALADLCTSVALHCSEQIGNAVNQVETTAALSAANVALRAAAAALDAAPPTRWEPGIREPRMVNTVDRPVPAGRVQVATDVYDHIMKLARRWARYADAGRASVGRILSPWLEQDLDLLCAAVGVPLREDGAQREDDDEIRADDARTARHAHAVHMATQAWRTASDQQRNQVMGASPALHAALSMLVRESR